MSLVTNKEGFADFLNKVKKYKHLGLFTIAALTVVGAYACAPASNFCDPNVTEGCVANTQNIQNPNNTVEPGVSVAYASAEDQLRADMYDPEKVSPQDIDIIQQLILPLPLAKYPWWSISRANIEGCTVEDFAENSMSSYIPEKEINCPEDVGQESGFCTSVGYKLARDKGSFTTYGVYLRQSSNRLFVELIKDVYETPDDVVLDTITATPSSSRQVFGIRVKNGFEEVANICIHGDEGYPYWGPWNINFVAK